MMRRLGDGCSSDLMLDRWLSGELTASEQRAAEAHLQGCASCRARRAELQAAHRDFAREAPPLAALGRVGLAPGYSQPVASEAPSWLRAGLRPSTFWFAGAAALAAAAALVLVVGAPWRASERASDEAPGLDTRTKGGLARFGWMVRRGERTFEGRPEQPLRAGDALRFSVSAREPVFVAIFGRDADTTSVYYPDGKRLARVEAGHAELLSAAIELDATLDPQQLIAVFCTSPVSLAPVRAAVERSPREPALPAGCSSEHRTLLKEPP